MHRQIHNTCTERQTQAQTGHMCMQAGTDTRGDRHRVCNTGDSKCRDLLASCWRRLLLPAHVQSQDTQGSNGRGNWDAFTHRERERGGDRQTDKHTVWGVLFLCGDLVHVRSIFHKW